MSDYKKTLNLPATSFPMKANLKQKEPELLDFWAKSGAYQAMVEARQGKPRYVLHDGPPYANGRLHMGHALNKILKDIIVKSRHMAGYQAPYVPGWDCHGLPIEHKVEQQLKEKGKTDLPAVVIRKLCREYAMKFVDIQRKEFKRLGVFGEWDDPYLTMKPAYESATAKVLCEFVESGSVV
ncbi:class I tRNA ligase family protein, partial [Desulfolutivibrio sp.]|uniref:class I tRNA ligase family protein n=1 Tax=Desulfolutivibrio sp. TaxID=2773296 RepID=UPI002F9669BA